MKPDHISLFLTETEYATPPKRTLRRWWNQLSSLQRGLCYTTLLICLIIALYILPNSSQIEEVTTPPPPPPKISVTESYKVTNYLKAPAPRKFKGPQNERQVAVVNAFKYAWENYKTYAWGYDHLLPASGHSGNWFGLGLTIVDSLDTLYIMGLNEEYLEAREWVQQNLTFNTSIDVNLFEVTIRVLGGLLSIYHLSGDVLFLTKARILGEKLLPCFDSPSGIPYSDINLLTGLAHGPRWSPDSSTSEVTTIQLEFNDLSRCTKDPRFSTAATKVSQIIHKLDKPNGLVPIFINPNTGQFRTYATITMGARGDSYYEYLLKQWIQTREQYLLDDYLRGIEGAQQVLMKRTTSTNLLFVGELIGTHFKPKMDHLTCYLPGTLALGVKYGAPQQHKLIAQELLETCYQMYARQPTFLAPEITYFNPDMYVKSADAHNLLRPEFIESLWYMSILDSTNRTKYQNWGFQILEAFDKYSKVRFGYTSIGNVRNEKQVKPLDKMESFFLAETLKYLYLLFCDDDDCQISLDEYVINSEAHLIPIM